MGGKGENPTVSVPPLRDVRGPSFCSCAVEAESFDAPRPRDIASGDMKRLAHGFRVHSWRYGPDRPRGGGAPRSRGMEFAWPAVLRRRPGRGATWSSTARRTARSLSACRGADLLLDCIAYDERHAAQLLDVQGSVGRLVAISSASVYRDATAARSTRRRSAASPASRCRSLRIIPPSSLAPRPTPPARLPWTEAPRRSPRAGHRPAPLRDPWAAQQACPGVVVREAPARGRRRIPWPMAAEAASRRPPPGQSAKRSSTLSERRRPRC